MEDMMSHLVNLELGNKGVAANGTRIKPSQQFLKTFYNS